MAMNYATAAGAIQSQPRSRWRRGAHRSAAAIGLMAADVASFALIFLILRLHEPVPAVVLFPSGQPRLTSSIDVFLLCGILFITIRLFLGDYTRRQLFWESARATTITLALLALIDFALATVIGWRAVTFSLTSWLAIAAAIPLIRQAARRALSVAGLWQFPAALLGSGNTAAEVHSSLGNSLALGFDFRYIVQAPGDTDLPDELAHLTRLSLDAALSETDCAQLVIASDSPSSPELSTFIQRAIASGTGVVIIPALRGLPLFGLQTNYFFGREMVLLQVRNNLTRFPSRIVKRLTDIVGASLLLLLLLPVLLLVALAVKLDSNGPVLFRQPRLGRDARLFTCFKFRTMTIDAEERLEAWRNSNPELFDEYVRSNFKLRHDPRVTRIGHWLRRFSLDELPQLLNVLGGSMSLVGPRPLLAKELPDYGSAINLYYCVRPGITGLWQTRGRSTTTFRDRVVFDEWYILNWSYWYDIVILLQTVHIVIAGKGAY